MGLSRKLGQTSSPQTSATGSQIVAYQWSHQSYTIQDILKKFKLPCVVQCATESCSVVWSDFQFDLRQPLLLYSLRTVRKIHARSLDKNTLEEFGPPVAIPEDYDGWFASTPKGVNKLKRHTRVQGIADANATSFLVCTKCPGFTSSKSFTSSLNFIPHEVAAGETLKRVCVMEGDADDTSALPFVQMHGPCLECLDEKGEDVVLPLSHRVMTYEIAESFPDEDHKVVSTKSIIAAGNKHLPRVFTVIHGDPPTLSYSFTGLYRGYTIFTEETVLAATLGNPKSTCLELATDSCAKFNIGLNDSVIKKTCEYSNAFQVCHSAGEKFATGIKVSFSLNPHVSGLDDIDLNMYENMSSDEVQEVDANSEFEIAWGSGGRANLNPRDFVNKKISKEEVSESETGDQNNLEKLKSVNEINSTCSMEKSEDDKLPSEFLPQAEVCDENELSEPLSTAVGEDIVKENPLFMSSIRDSESEHEFGNEDISVISEDIVEISIEETDYSTMIIKKASEYNDVLLDSDNSDSEVEESIMQYDQPEEETLWVKGNRETDGSEHGVASGLISQGETSNNSISESENKTNNVTIPMHSTECNNSNQSVIADENEPCTMLYSGVQDENLVSISASLDESSTQDSTIETVSNRINNSMHHDAPTLPSQANDTLNNVGSTDSTAGTAQDTSLDVSVQYQTVIEKTRDISQTSNVIESSPTSQREKVSSNFFKSLPHKSKSNTNQKTHESRMKTDLSVPFIDRLRKFKSGSNVNVCSDLDTITDNKFQSSKVKHFPHSHPHMEKKSTFQNTSGCPLQRETTQDKIESHKRPKGDLLRLNGKSTSSITSVEDVNINKHLAVVNETQSFSDNDIQDSEMSETNMAISHVGNKFDGQENIHKNSPDTLEKNLFEKEPQKAMISTIDGLDEESEEFA